MGKVLIGVEGGREASEGGREALLRDRKHERVGGGRAALGAADALKVALAFVTSDDVVRLYTLSVPGLTLDLHSLPLPLIEGELEVGQSIIQTLRHAPPKISVGHWECLTDAAAAAAAPNAPPPPRRVALRPSRPRL